MTLHELLDTIVASQVFEWSRIAAEGGREPTYKESLIVEDVGMGKNSRQRLEILGPSGVAVFIPNVSITIAWGLTWTEDFEEEWTKRLNFHNRTSSGHFVDVFFNGGMVLRERYVAVDDRRAFLPLPRIKTDENNPQQILAYEVAERQSKFFELLDAVGCYGDYRSYFDRARFTLSDIEWPRPRR